MADLGRAIRAEWGLDPAFLTVNHGSYGATPRVVLDAQDAWRRRMEAQPSRFMRAILPEALRAAAVLLGGFVGVAGENLVFVENATAGCNAVLGSVKLGAGDEVLALSHVYGAVRKAIRHVIGRAGAHLVEAPLGFPRPDADAVVAAIRGAIGPRTRLAVLDHVTSASALVLPIGRMIAACHDAGVPVLVDGAHAPGQVDLDIAALGADWYVGNCHKWLMAPKGCAFLAARADRQAGLHPVSISHGYGDGFLAEFDWTGTADHSAYLAIGAAVDFHQRLGGAALRRRNAALAAEAAALLAGRLGTETAGGNLSEGAMGLVRLPLAGAVDAARAGRLRDALLAGGTDAPLHELAGGIWLRLSAQAYNDIDDYRQLADLVRRVLDAEER